MKNRQQLDTTIKQASILTSAGRHQEALALASPFLRLFPKNFQVLLIIGTCYVGLKENNKALSYLLMAEKIDPKNHEILTNIAIAYKGLNDIQAALKYYNLVIELNPTFAQGHLNLGNTFFSQEEWLNAIQCYTNAISRKIDYVDAYINLSLTLTNIKKYDETIDVCDLYLKQFGLNNSIIINKCTAIFQKGLKSNAIKIIEAYIQENKNSGELHTLAANMYSKVKNYSKAVEHYNEAIKIKPSEYANYNNLGILQMEYGQFDSAIASFEESIKINPNSAIPHQNIANIFNQKKDFSKSLFYLRNAQKIDPAMPYNKGMIASTMGAMCDWQGLHSLINSIERSIDNENTISNPFAPITYLKSQYQLTKIAKDWVTLKCPESNFFPPFDSLKKSGKIKIGYFSADFYYHATSILMAGLFEQHDRSKFEIYAFSFGPNGEDDLSVRIRLSFDHFIDVSQLSDRAITAYSRELGIDIAMDLKGFTQNSRAAIFTERAAPIQINYLGFPGSMGAPYIDYIIADNYIIPQELECNYTEHVLRMPHCYQPNDRLRSIDNTKHTRSMHQLPEEALVLCCFNNNYKITPEIYSIWMRILAKFPQTVLWLLKDNSSVEQNLKMEAQARGVNPNRLIFADRVSATEHLARHQCADLFLDTYPCNAHTTASDALWVGLPIVTCSGNSFASRVAGSLLYAIGFESLVTQSIEEYEAKIVELLKRPDQLAQLRQRLEANRLISPLFDTVRYTKDFEELLINVYEKIPNSSH